ncbi:MAG: hypothetical protein LHW55_00585 [Candidatus Cloacimonetes bacterium]|nr:hypothetical protein [Candidatus Cloacimonadota bacterium]
MDAYRQLARYPIFTAGDVEELTGNKNTAYSLIKSLIKRGLARKIRNNQYSLVNPATDQLVANKYQIASSITPTSYISHHSAFEYYGLSNQVYNELYVSSKTKFYSFEYEGITYTYVASRMDEGIVEAKNIKGVVITDLERTVIDSIHDVNKIAGFEELLNCIEGVQYLDESKIKKYLQGYNKQILFQRSGFIFEHLQPTLGVSSDLIEYCNRRVGLSKRYLINDAHGRSTFNRKWNLMVPDEIYSMMGKEGDDFV